MPEFIRLSMKLGKRSCFVSARADGTGNLLFQHSKIIAGYIFLLSLRGFLLALTPHLPSV